MVDLVGLGVRWEKYIQVQGGELRVWHDRIVMEIVGCYGRICSGSEDGAIRV